MKKYMALFLTVLLVFALLAGCSSQKTASDSAKIKKAGKLVVGITDFAPMDYRGMTDRGSASTRTWPEPLRKAWASRRNSPSSTGTTRPWSWTQATSTASGTA